MKATLEERFWAKVNKTDGCWLWTAYIDPRGYGGFQYGGRRDQVKINAHRWSYLNTVGPIPEGLVLDHLCRVRHCVRPDHLEPVTLVANVMRGDGWAAKNARKTHCHRGHEFTEANTFRQYNSRQCRACLQHRQDLRRSTDRT